MFDLEHSISEWHQQMRQAGIKDLAVLDELESHLREDTERQVRQGAIASKAFELAVRQLGNASLIKAEFNKTNQTKIMKREFIIGAGVIGILVGMGFVMPAIAEYRHEGAMANGEIWLLLLGALLTLVGAGAALIGAKRRTA